MTTIKKINKSNIKLAVKFLVEGNLASFPTETVYGLGGDATNSLAIAKVYETKNRPIFNPLIIHFSSFDQIKENCEINDDVKKLSDLFWPGPMTIILKKKKDSKICELASAGLDTIGVRIPNNKTALELIKLLKLKNQKAIQLKFRRVYQEYRHVQVNNSPYLLILLFFSNTSFALMILQLEI